MNSNGREYLSDTVKLWLAFLATIVIIRWSAIHMEAKAKRICINGLQASITTQDSLSFLQENSSCLRYIITTTH